MTHVVRGLISFLIQSKCNESTSSSSQYINHLLQYEDFNVKLGLNEDSVKIAQVVVKERLRMRLQEMNVI